MYTYQSQKSLIWNIYWEFNSVIIRFCFVWTEEVLLRKSQVTNVVYIDHVQLFVESSDQLVI